MRMYMVRFWRRMLTLGKTVEDVKLILDVGIINKEEYEAIIGE